VSKQSALLTIDEFESIFTTVMNKREKTNDLTQIELNRCKSLETNNKQLNDKIVEMNNNNYQLQEKMTDYYQQKERVAILENNNKQLQEKISSHKQLKHLLRSTQSDKNIIESNYNTLQEQLTHLQNQTLAEIIQSRLSKSRITGLQIVRNPKIYYTMSTNSSKSRKTNYSDIMN
jgi:hypothetical protein